MLNVRNFKIGSRLISTTIGAFGFDDRFCHHRFDRLEQGGRKKRR